MGVSIGDLVGTALQIPLANRGDNLELGVEGLDGSLKTNLVVTLAGAAVGDGVGTELVGGAHEMLGDERAGNGGNQRIHTLIQGVGLQRLHAVFIGEFVAGVYHIRFNGTAGKRALLDGFELSPPWPTSRDTATTSLPVRSFRYEMATEVSRPPEYAKTRRF